MVNAQEELRVPNRPITVAVIVVVTNVTANVQLHLHIRLHCSVSEGLCYDVSKAQI